MSTSGTQSASLSATVFVSYPREDRDFVARIASLLEQRNISSWVDTKDIPRGSPDWNDEVQGAIESTDAFVAILSDAALSSPACIAEMNHAVAVGQRLIVLQRGKLAEPDRLPAEFRGPQWIAAQPDQPVDRVVDAVQLEVFVDYEWTSMHRDLRVGEKKWRDAGSRRDKLLVRSDLAQVEATLAKYGSSELQPLDDRQLGFVDASRRAAMRRTRWWTGSAFAVIASLSGLLAFALIQRSGALAQRDSAQSRELAAGAVDRIDADPALAVTLARLAIERRVTPQAQLALQRVLLRSNIERTLTSPLANDGRNIALSPNGAAVASTNLFNKRTSITNLTTGSQIALPRGRYGELVFAEFSRDGRRLVTRNGAGRVTIWDVASRGRIAAWADSDGFKDVVLMRDRLVALRDFGDVAVRGLDGSRMRAPSWLAHEHVIAISHDARTAITTGPNLSIAVVTAHGRVTLPTHGNSPSAKFTQDDSRVILGTWRGPELWTVKRPRRVALLPTRGGQSSANGQRFAALGADGVLLLYNAVTGRLIRRVPGFPASIDRMELFDSHGDRVIIVSTSGEVAIWSTRSRMTPVATYRFDRLSSESATLLAGNRAYSVGPGGPASTATLTIWDIAEGTVLTRRALPADRDNLAVDPTGRFAVMSRPTSRSLEFLSLGDGRVQRIQGTSRAIFSPDGQRLLIAGNKRIIWLDVPHLDRGGTFTTDLDRPSLAVSDDGSRLALHQDKVVEVYKWPSGEMVLKRRADELTSSQPLSADGRLLALRSGASTLVVNTISDRVARILPTVEDGAMSPYGDIFVTSDGDNATLWSVAAGERLATFRLPTPMTPPKVSFAHRSLRFMVASASGAVFDCNVCIPLSDLGQLAQERGARPLTALERATYSAG